MEWSKANEVKCRRHWRGEKFLLLVEGGKNDGRRKEEEEERRSGIGEVLLLGGLRVLHVFAPSCSQLAKSIPMAVGRVKVPRFSLYPYRS